MQKIDNWNKINFIQTITSKAIVEINNNIY